MSIIVGEETGSIDLEAVSLETEPCSLNLATAAERFDGISGTGNSIVRRLRDPNFITRYFVGHGIDIGCNRSNTLGNYSEFFPLMQSCMTWDIHDGDAQYMKAVPSEAFDFVHSSHCLEHLRNPFVGISSWWRILRPGGHLVVIVPDEDMYEQGVWPSQFNGDHKSSFTTYKKTSWCKNSVNVFDLLMRLVNADTIKVERLISTFRRTLRASDQSVTNIGEPAIEFIVGKRG